MARPQHPRPGFVVVDSTSGATASVTDNRLDVNSNISGYADSTNPIRKDMEGGGRVEVGTSAVAVNFTGTPTYSIIITADRNNTGLLFIGESDVTEGGTNSVTFLEAGDALEVDYDDSTNGVFVVASTNNQFFYKGALL